jgi:Ras-related protein Rab-3D
MKNHIILYDVEEYDYGYEAPHEAVTLTWKKNVKTWIFMYSITNLSSFEKIPVLKAKLLKDLQESDLGKYPCYLVGNKCDLSDDREVSTEVAGKFAEENGFTFFECSSKSNQTVEMIIVTLCTKMRDLHCISPPEDPKRKKSGCKTQ